MSRKPEAVAKASIHRRLPVEVYHQSMYTPYSYGTPDDYYEGTAGEQWVEYKYTTKLPGLLELYNTRKKPSLSEHQLLWVNRAHNNHRPVAVVLFEGRTNCYIFLNKEWMQPWTKEQLQSRTISRQQLTDWIVSRTTR